VCRYRLGDTIVKSVIGDITLLEVDAIVNPANSYMLMGGGLAGVLKRKGGRIIEDEARRFAPVPIGEAVVTTAGSLPAKYIIHAPTMIKPADTTSREYVYKAMYASLVKAEEYNLKTIAVPGLGTGVGGLNPHDACESMIKALLDYYSEHGLRIYEIVFIDINEIIPKTICQILSGLKGVVKIEDQG